MQTQTGNSDTQSIVQNGDANYAAYTQVGNNLPDLSIKQTGGMSVTVLQSH
jgi:hypothetical protein